MLLSPHLEIKPQPTLQTLQGPMQYDRECTNIQLHNGQVVLKLPVWKFDWRYFHRSFWKESSQSDSSNSVGLSHIIRERNEKNTRIWKTALAYQSLTHSASEAFVCRPGLRSAEGRCVRQAPSHKKASNPPTLPLNFPFRMAWFHSSSCSPYQALCDELSQSALMEETGEWSDLTVSREL